LGKILNIDSDQFIIINLYMYISVKIIEELI